MKKLLFVIILLLPVISSAQYRGNNWCISDSILLHFAGSGNTISSSVIHSTDYKNSFVEGMATISDDSGKLLFYTNGFTVWNRSHQVMLNGDSLQCNFSVTNGVIIIPVPEHDSLYYIFYINWLLTKPFKGLSYSLVNMHHDGGLGEIIKKNVSLTQVILTEKLSAVKHGNGRDWWIVSHEPPPGNSFYKFLITPDSIYGPTLQSYGLKKGHDVTGEMCFSKDGSKLGYVNGDFNEVFNFDRCTGILSSDIVLDSAIGAYGCSFSPDGSKFYVSHSQQLFQFDLNNSSPWLTKTIIWTNPYYSHSNIDSMYIIAQHELGPDEKIYVSIGYDLWPDKTHYSFIDMNLSIINRPDSLGLKCDFKPYSFYLGGYRATEGLPNMPNYNLGRLEASACDTVYTIINKQVEVKSLMRIYPNPAQDELTIEILNGVAPNQITLSYAMGRAILLLTPRRPNIQLNIHALPTGIYFIKAQMSNGSVEVKKLVKQ